MSLNNQLFTVIYDSGSEYVVSFEEELNKIRLFLEEEDGEFQCFTTFSAMEPSGEDWKSLEDIKLQSIDLIAAYDLEPPNTLTRIIEHKKAEDYPPQ